MSSKRRGNKRRVVPKVVKESQVDEEVTTPVTEEVQTETDEEKDVYDPEKPMSEEESASDSGSEPDELPPEKPKPASSTTRKTVKSETKTKQTRKADVNSEETQDPDKRYFKILIDKIISEDDSPQVSPDVLSSGGGRYTGRNPMQAAKKAFTRICRAAADGGESFSYIFSIQETTQSSAKKIFVYRGVRKALENPQKVTKGETHYEVCFASEVRSYKPDAKPAAKKSIPVEQKTGAGRGKNPVARGKPVTSTRGGRGRKK